jgi:predicted outer membrane repeat protein
MGHKRPYQLCFLALTIVLGSCLSIENGSPLNLPWSSSGTYPLEARIDAVGVEVLSVRAEVDGLLLPMSSLGGARYGLEISRPRCTRGFSARYLVEYRQSSTGPIQTKTEPSAGHFLFRIEGVPGDCPEGVRRELIVDDLGDGVDVAPGDGACATLGGFCTLRAAVMEANALPGADMVRLPGGTITLSLTTGAHRFGIAVTDSLTIRGEPRVAGTDPTSRITVLPAAGASHGGHGFPVFDIAATGSAAISVHIADVMLGGGYGLYGGLIRNRAALLVEGSVLADARHAAQGGAIHNAGTLTLERSVVRNNEAGVGGGIFNSGTLLVRASTLHENRADNGGAIHAWLGRVELWNSTLSGNVARVEGGGLQLLYPATTLVRSSTLTRNHAGGRGGAISGQTSTLIELGHSIVAGNSATPAESSDANTVLTSLGHNLLGVCGTAGACTLASGSASTDRAGSVAVPLDAVLLGLAQNGGLAPTHLPHPSSPAVSGGSGFAPSDANALACTRLDQRGTARAQGAGCDIGAVEQ